MYSPYPQHSQCTCFLQVAFGLDNPRRITYDRQHQVLGVAYTRSEPVRVGDPETSKSFFRLLDASSLIRKCLEVHVSVDDTSYSEDLSQFNCEPDEEITALETLSLTSDGHAHGLSYICVGTFFYQADETEPTEGRVLVFRTYEVPPSSSQQLSLVTSVQVEGCVYAMANANGMLAVAINASVREASINLMHSN
jgi:DNA damage-binding protein 1